MNKYSLVLIHEDMDYHVLTYTNCMYSLFFTLPNQNKNSNFYGILSHGHFTEEMYFFNENYTTSLNNLRKS